MKNLIKKILKENFDWAKDVEPVDIGGFDEEDVSWDDEDAKVYLGEEGKVTFNLSEDEAIEYLYDGYDDWTFHTLITTNGTYDGYGDDDYMDDDEINYLGGYLTDEQKERLQKILDYYVKREGLPLKQDVDSYINDGFSRLEKYIDAIYTGRHDWDDFTNDALSSLGTALNRNRWNAVNESFLTELKDNDVDMDYYNSVVKIEIPFPYKGNNKLDEVLSLTGLDDHSWSDEFYEDWDPSGAEEDIRWSFDQMLDVVEEQIDEETNS